MHDFPSAARHHRPPRQRTHHASSPGPGGDTLDRLREVIQSALSRDIGLIRMGLPPGCPAAWFGDVTADYITYTGSIPVAASTVAHAAAHLSLLHCSRIRDGGRFACIDARKEDRDLRYRIHAFLDEESDALPAPLFTAAEERAADEAAAALLAGCDCDADALALLSGENPAFRCLG